MSQYSQEILKVVVAKICQTIGWHSIQTTPLEIMVDILRRYLSEITKHTQSYATLFGHTQPNLDELGLAFRDLHINIADLEEYVRYVDSSPPIESPMFPIPKESHLNFLKPGSGEVVTRPVHVNEHLPPMFKISEEADLVSQVKQEECSNPSNTDANQSPSSVAVFKRPADLSPNEPSIKRPRLVMEEEGRPTREISSVMMTTSGFLSPAREGKLPEARTPISAIETIPPPSTSTNRPQSPQPAQQQQPQQPAPPPPATNTNPMNEPRFEKERKPPKVIREPKKVDKRKDKTSKELFKPDDLTIHPKKMGMMKDPTRMKNMKNISNNNTLMPPHPNKPIKSPNKNKQPKQAKQISPIPPPSPIPPMQKPVDKIEGKLSSEPDKSKLNIFKKISKVKDEKMPDKHKLKEEPIDLESRESSPDLIIDENHWDSKINKQMNEPSKASTPDIKNSPHHSSDKDFLYDDDLSPPGTPSTPKTPEMPTHSPPQKVEKEGKRKRKDKTPKIKNKQPKMSRNMMSPRRKNDSGNYEQELERPKTPNDPINMVMKDDLLPLPMQQKTSMFNLFPGLLPSGPGLIPPPMANPLFPRLPLTGPLPKHGFGQPAHITPAMPVLPFVPIPPQPQMNQMPFKPQLSPVDQVTIEKIPIQPVDPPVKKHANDGIISPTKEKHKKDKKDKPKKKNKKDKIKNKSEKRKLKEEKKEKDKIKKKDKKKDKEREQHEGSVPKLTLKIGSPRPPTPDVQIARKIMIKPVVKKDEDQVPASTNQEKREPSPELARISALITRPPKLKPTTKPTNDHHISPNSNPNANPNQNPHPSSNFDQPIPTFHAKLKKNMFRSVPKIKNRDRKQRDSTDDVNDLRMSPPPRVVESPQNDLANTALVAAAPTAFYIDSYGNKVWICPACGGQDDGSPMIGCDDCDAWYHWVCVGIQVPPDDNEDWYCRICIVKKQETIQMDKKKKRKKKERKEH